MKRLALLLLLAAALVVPRLAQAQGLTMQMSNGAGLFLQPDGTFASTASNLAGTVGGLGTANATFSYAAGVLPAGAYTVTVVAGDGALTTTKTSAFTVAASPPAGNPAITAYSGFTAKLGSYTMGSMFTVDAATNVSALGIFDGNGNGVFDNATDTPAGLWRQSDGALLGQVTVAKTAASEGGWFYANLPAPVALQPGTVYVIASVVSSTGEPYATSGTLATIAGVHYTGKAYKSGTTLVYPVTQSTGVGYGVPNFKTS